MFHMLNKTHVKTHVVSRHRIALAFAIIVVGIIVPTAIANAVVSDEPRRDLPIVLDGEVWSAKQVGDAIVVAGNFTQVQTSRNGPVVDQAAIFAYDADSGAFIEGFRPILIASDGFPEVFDVVGAPDGQSVYIGGRFTAIDDQSDDRTRSRNRIARLDVSTGRVDRTFSLGGVSAKVQSLEVSNGYLYVGGIFETVFDTAPGRAPILHSVRGLARFNANTAAYDATFAFESQDDISATAIGVSNLEMNPAGNRLVVAHRGAKMVNVNNNKSVSAGGLAVIAIAPDQTASLTNFKALYPNPADPIQDFYHRGQCNNRGVQIRDMEISPDGSYVVLVHQGGDLGYQCDTAVRFELGDAPVRPTWASRVFDSIFSVGVADDAVYIGGHFRYLVSPTAPSAFPGKIGANGASPGQVKEQWYEADPNDPGQDGIDFKNDLFDPGYVFRAVQIGALDPDTGYGVPSWTPTSDAGLGVLDLTVIDGGLLLGQDNGRINDQVVGRSAFFVDAKPECSVELNVDGRPEITWSGFVDVGPIRVLANDSLLERTTGLSVTDITNPTGSTVTYQVRFDSNGTQTLECGTITIPTSFDCSVNVVGNAVTVTWIGDSWAQVTVLRNGENPTAVRGANTHTDNPGPGTWMYTLEAVAADGTGAIANCGSITIVDTTPTPTIECNATVTNGTVRVSWEDQDWLRVTILRNGRWLATVANVESYDDTPEASRYTYLVRGITTDGERIESECSPVNVGIVNPTIECSATVTDGTVRVSWENQGWVRVTILRDGGWLATVANVASYEDTPAAGTYTYRVRGITANEERFEADCSPITVGNPTPPVGGPTIECSATVTNGTVRVSWEDQDWLRVTILRNGRWLATVANVESRDDTPAPGTYTYRVRGITADEERIEADCSPITVGNPAPPVGGPTLECTATRVAGQTILRWNNVGAAGYHVRLHEWWLTTVGAGVTTYTAPNSGWDYSIRYWVDGQQTTAVCEL